MAKVILTTRVNPEYDDLPEQRYHFPRSYLRAIERAIGDFAIYYEPRRIDTVRTTGGRQAYFACARILGCDADPTRRDHYYARISDYLDFPTPVPFRADGQTLESALRNSEGGTNLGSFQRAVRTIPDDEFDEICRRGFGAGSGQGEYVPKLELDDEGVPYQRPIIEAIVRRPYRDAAFAITVGQAYGHTCALTGLKLINGGGRAEVEAAHIRPVGGRHDGPDSIRNGIALCRTAHWLFDRGLVSLDDSHRILVAAERMPDDFRRLLRPDGRALVPGAAHLRPHPQFLGYHRQRIFKG